MTGTKGHCSENFPGAQPAFRQDELRKRHWNDSAAHVERLYVCVGGASLVLQHASASGFQRADCVSQVLELCVDLVVERNSEILASPFQQRNNERAGDVSDPSVP